VKKELIKLAALGACFCLAGTASALQTVESLNVTASVEQICTASATPLAFGAYSEMFGNNATSVLTLDCSPGTQFDIALDAGQYPASMGGPRGMVDFASGARLDYDLSGPVGPWGDNGMTYSAPSFWDTALGGPVDYMIDGYVFPGQPVPAGSYSDVVTITVSY